MQKKQSIMKESYEMETLSTMPQMEAIITKFNQMKELSKGFGTATQEAMANEYLDELLNIIVEYNEKAEALEAERMKLHTTLDVITDRVRQEDLEEENQQLKDECDKLRAAVDSMKSEIKRKDDSLNNPKLQSFTLEQKSSFFKTCTPRDLYGELKKKGEYIVLVKNSGEWCEVKAA